MRAPHLLRGRQGGPKKFGANVCIPSFQCDFCKPLVRAQVIESRWLANRHAEKLLRVLQGRCHLWNISLSFLTKMFSVLFEMSWVPGPKPVSQHCVADPESFVPPNYLVRCVVHSFEWGNWNTGAYGNSGGMERAMKGAWSQTSLCLSTLLTWPLWELGGVMLPPQKCDWGPIRGGRNNSFRSIWAKIWTHCGSMIEVVWSSGSCFPFLSLAFASIKWASVRFRRGCERGTNCHFPPQSILF